MSCSYVRILVFRRTYVHAPMHASTVCTILSHVPYADEGNIDPGLRAFAYVSVMFITMTLYIIRVFPYLM